MVKTEIEKTAIALHVNVGTGEILSLGTFSETKCNCKMHVITWYCYTSTMTAFTLSYLSHIPVPKVSKMESIFERAEIKPVDSILPGLYH